MVEYKLPVEKFAPEARKIAKVEPMYVQNGVSYYDRMPSEPEERPRHTLLPMYLIGDWVRDFVENYNSNPENKKKKNIGWIVDVEKKMLVNPGYGSAQHYAEVHYDESGNLTNFVSDGMLWENGALDKRTGIATPGAVVAPLEKREDGIFVHCTWQWRPSPMDAEIKVPAELTDPKDIEDFKALNTGEWFLTTPGGFANFSGDKSEDVAKREALEEAGLRVDKPFLVPKSFNRANIRTKVNVGFSTFKRVGSEIKDEGEKLFGKLAVRIDKFRTTDDMVSAAVNIGREELGLISSGASK